VALQAGVSASADPRLRVSGGTHRGLTWQASAQVVGRPGDGWSAFPALGPRSGSYVAVRGGVLGRIAAADQVTLEIGLALEPLSGFEGAARGMQTDFGPIGAMVMMPMAWFHTAETTVGLDVGLGSDSPVSLWAGSNLTAASLWFDGSGAMDDEDLTDRQTVELLQPSVALEVSL